MCDNQVSRQECVTKKYFIVSHPKHMLSVFKRHISKTVFKMMGQKIFTILTHLAYIANA